MDQLRQLQFDDIRDAVADAHQLLTCGYIQQGNWSLGQICRHLTLVQEGSIVGYPTWMSLFAPLRPLMRRFLLPRLLGRDSPRGIRTASIYVPPDHLDDTVEWNDFADSVDRLLQYSRPYAPHPGFGRLPREKILEIHAAHAAHHLRHLWLQQEDDDISRVNQTLP